MQTQMAIDPKERPRYSPEQLQTYFERIKIPKRFLHSPVFTNPILARTVEYGLSLAQALARYHVCSVPFENLELHYSADKHISLDAADLYLRFAKDGQRYGRGGRCMENNTFFGIVLRSLGYEVRNCAARVSRMLHPSKAVRQTQGETYNGFSHMLNLVRFDDQWYVVDVGMGIMGPNIIFPLQDGYESLSVPPRRIRLQKRVIPERASLCEEYAPTLWCFDVCSKPSLDGCSKWITTYCFTETEYLPQDYEIMSWFTSTSPKSFFTSLVICQKMLLDEAADSIVGSICLLDMTLYETVRGQKTVLAEFATEQERIAALADVFHIHLSDTQQRAVFQKLA